MPLYFQCRQKERRMHISVHVMDKLYIADDPALYFNTFNYGLPIYICLVFIFGWTYVKLFPSIIIRADLELICIRS